MTPLPTTGVTSLSFVVRALGRIPIWLILTFMPLFAFTTKGYAKRPSLQFLEKRRKGKVVQPLNVILNGVPDGCPGVAIVSLRYITLNLIADTPYSLQSAWIDGVVAKATPT